MPQMAPMSWLLLFLFFTIMLIMINILNYYLFTPKIAYKSAEETISVKTNNWKW
uniref:ATP synthase complex subunit 8 n=2 Tax=Anax TaxID=39259 RepID=A0A7M1I7K2_ANAPR|nr:ATP synthase F0 subunit 8 [Anax imperator]AOW43645.1 ATP synthase F0 subunit 8 [Anax imperator]QOQ35059.1 ATP synthase F0 subunit 8 [Anax parthenope]